MKDVDQDGRTRGDRKRNFHYSVNSEGIEYLIAHATIEEVTEDEILTEEWPHKQAMSDFFPDVKKGQKWHISYNGNNPWTLISSAIHIP